MNNKDFGTICAVLVTYNIGARLLAHFDALASQVNHIIVVDNGSQDETPSVLAALKQKYQSFIDIQMNTRNNLAGAQNIGINAAKAARFDWVLLMDHDSIPEPGMVAAMKVVYGLLPAAQKEKTGILAPRLRLQDVPREVHYLYNAGKWMLHRKVYDTTRPYAKNILSVVSSGSLIPSHLFDKVGMMDESLNIDYVDVDFCLRSIALGYAIIAVRDAFLKHSFGHSRQYKIWGQDIVSTNHPPERRYYIYRNKLIIWRRYGIRFPGFLLFDVARTFYDLARIALLEEDRRRKLRSIWEGLRDGCRDLKGAKPANPA